MESFTELQILYCVWLRHNKEKSSLRTKFTLNLEIKLEILIQKTSLKSFMELQNILCLTQRVWASSFNEEGAFKCSQFMKIATKKEQLARIFGWREKIGFLYCSISSNYPLNFVHSSVRNELRHTFRFSHGLPSFFAERWDGVYHVNICFMKGMT